MNFASVGFYGTSVIGTFILFMYTIFNQSSPDEFWILVAERLGIPVLLILAMIVLMIKFFNKVYPFIESQIKDLIAIPKDQLIAERAERKAQQDTFDVTVEKLVQGNESNIKELVKSNETNIKELVGAIDKLTSKLDNYLDRIERK